MNLKKFSIPLALAAVFGAANSSSAVTFAPNTKITFTERVYQINAAGGTFGDGTSYPSIAPEFDGGADLPTALFDLISGIDFIDGNPTTGVVLNAPVSDAANTLLTIGAEAVGYDTGTVDSRADNGVPGTATFGVAAIGSNDFGIPFSDVAYAVSTDGVLFGQLNEANGTDSYFFTIYDPGPNGVPEGSNGIPGGDDIGITHEFALTEITTFCYRPTGGGGLNIGFGSLFDAGCDEGVFAFNGDGFVQLADGTMKTPGIWQFNGTGFADEDNDGVTRLTGNDVTFTTTGVPEPSALLGLASILGLGVFGKRKKQA
jgi:hypothetical protein